VSLTGDDPLTRSGKVAFSGVIMDVSLSFVPEADVGDFVLVHAGFAIAKIDEAEAARSRDYFDLLDAAVHSPDFRQ
jgi:hydrogenase expression/formation protein HypC